MDAALQQLIARDAIRLRLERLARGEDRRDAELIRSCWWPDATYDYGVQNGDFASYLAWVVPGADAIKDTQHVLGQSYIVIDGADSARVETHVISYHRVDYGDGQDRDTCIGGRYLDRMERRGGEWRIAERTMLYDWYQDWGQAADWSQGIMGYPFHGPNYTGRVKDDASVAFFAGKPF